MIDIVHDGNIIFVACDIVFEVDSGNFAKFILRAVVRFLVPISMVFFCICHLILTRFGISIVYRHSVIRLHEFMIIINNKIMNKDKK